jgi:phosphatidate cytidylyltransferase
MAGLSAAAGAPAPAIFVALTSAGVALAVAFSAAADSPRNAALLLAVVPAVVVSAAAMTLARLVPSRSAFTAAAVMVMGPLYVGVPLGLLSWVREASGPGLTTWLLTVIVVSDTAQYFSGVTFGRHKLAPLVSPGKTIEGAIGGFVAVAVFGAATAGYVLAGLSPPAGAILALTLAVAGLAGDLFESWLKRSAGVKDSSTLIPGHGGVLDRIDSHLFAAPAFYVAARLIW